MQENSCQVVRLEDYAPSEFLVEKVHLTFELAERDTVVKTLMSLRRNPRSTNREQTLFLDGIDLKLRSLHIDGTPVADRDYRLDESGLYLFGVPDVFELQTEVIIQPQDNTVLEGLYCSGGMFCTQCEAEGFRRITFFPDRPDVMATYTTSIVADKKRYPVLLSNGNLLSSEDLPDGLHRVTWHDPFPKPSYLFALVAGDIVFEEGAFVTASGRSVALRVYLQRHNLGRGTHALEALKKAMLWDEKVFGLEYDLDLYMIVAVDDFNMGAMENKGLNIFNSKYVLADRETATDLDFQAIEEVVAHEYFHNWTGNRVTCRDWFQLSLKEGLTVFRDQQFSADEVARSLKRIHDVRLLRTVQFAEDSGPLAHPVRPEAYQEINNFYTATVYEKGAEIVRMLHNLLGKEMFRRGLELYFSRFDGTAVTIEDFVKAMEDAAQVDLSQFRLWYSQAGTPNIRATGNYDESSKEFCLRLQQGCAPTPGQSDKQPLHIPVAIGLLNSTGTEMPVCEVGHSGTDCDTTAILPLKKTEQVFRFKVSERPVPSLLRGFSAPVRLTYNYSDAELMFLTVHDSDPFNRWDAAQQLVTQVIMRGVDRMADGQAFMVEPVLIDAFRQVLHSSSKDRGLAAQMLMLPSENYLVDQRLRIDIDGICTVRRKLREALSDALHDEWASVRQACIKDTSAGYGFSPEEVGCRSLKNVCLSYLAAQSKAGFWPQVRQWLDEADNMTDRLALLTLLAEVENAESQTAFAQFYQRAKDIPLVLDKWFAVQSGARHPLIVDKIRRLLAHEDFNLCNPNRVRAVLHTFARGNLGGFHAPSGAGYHLVGDYVMKLDRLNPQVSASLAGSFSAWRRFDNDRSALMKEQLNKMFSTEGISRDLREIVQRSLQDMEHT
ncbi:aminopeptidase N [Syntrophotalea carbinolica DSM 2380]|uniref:Aminopeptidase N n=1 Tax=Syntrophotalea carbinolica (strain DSM 2380 / NBRC 103641 / GraBd1) TaxID=338963 RepID=Q3A414_SYNC1|nr:aminopeptidase N [Syntrophotalea carbinolica]ABA88893.1 aminopeptidase N [Syntrophotalea carbinolica DSM 2380]